MGSALVSFHTHTHICVSVCLYVCVYIYQDMFDNLIHVYVVKLFRCIIVGKQM